MSSGDTIDIESKEAFPAKIAAIRDAIAEVRSTAAALPQIVESLAKEAGSFTRDGRPAPVYAPLNDAVKTWMDALSGAVSAVCDSAGNCADTAEYKATGMITTDHAAASEVLAT